MNIFLPAKRDGNSFFEEIIFYSRHNFTYGSYKDCNSKFNAIIIHWPEQIFEWNEPTKENLIDLENQFLIWKTHAKIIYVVHNLERHYGMSPPFKALYNLVLEYCDITVHFGDFSKHLFEQIYPNKSHYLIEHPLYERTFLKYEKELSREKLGLCKSSIVIMIPGTIRNYKEKQMVIRAFKSLPVKNKILLASNMKRNKFPFDFKGRQKLKLIIDVKKWYEKLTMFWYKKPTYYFSYNQISVQKFSYMVCASDVILIPRISILNSGNIYMGMTYRKMVVSPNIGNLAELNKLFNFPSFNPLDPKTLKNALLLAIDDLKNDNFSYNENDLMAFKPLNIAKKWDLLLDSTGSN